MSIKEYVQFLRTNKFKMQRNLDNLVEQEGKLIDRLNSDLSEEAIESLQRQLL